MNHLIWVIFGFFLWVAQPLFAQATVLDSATPSSITGNSPVPSRAFPGIFGIPSAFSAPGGTAYGVLRFAYPRAGISGAGSDGDLGFGVVFGSPIRNISLTAGVDITSLSNDFADSGALSLSAARSLRIGSTSATFAGASAGNLAAWGDASGSGPRYSAYLSHLRSVPVKNGILPILITGGYGEENTFRSDGSGLLRDGAFIGIGVGVAENLALSLSATQTQVNLGAITRIPNTDAGLSIGVFDVFNQVDRRQYALTISYAKSGLLGF